MVCSLASKKKTKFDEQYKKVSPAKEQIRGQARKDARKAKKECQCLCVN